MKWKLGRAALYGFIVGLVGFGLITVSDGGAELARLRSDPYGGAGYIVGLIASWPLLFIVVAFIRNRFVRS